MATVEEKATYIQPEARIIVLPAGDVVTTSDLYGLVVQSVESREEG